MTDARYTPGLWNYANGEIYAGNNPPIRVAWVGIGKSEGTNIANNIGNAHLIAAAPELLEALVAMREGLDILFARIIEAAPRDAAPETYHPSKSGKPWAALIQAKAAITKATGQRELAGSVGPDPRDSSIDVVREAKDND